MDQPIYPYNITTWTHFHVPVSYDVHNLESSSDESKTLDTAITPVLHAQAIVAVPGAGCNPTTN
jgi:hypothetical protein